MNSLALKWSSTRCCRLGLRRATSSRVGAYLVFRSEFILTTKTRGAAQLDDGCERRSRFASATKMREPTCSFFNLPAATLASRRACYFYCRWARVAAKPSPARLGGAQPGSTRYTTDKSGVGRCVCGAGAPATQQILLTTLGCRPIVRILVAVPLQPPPRAASLPVCSAQTTAAAAPAPLHAAAAILASRPPPPAQPSMAASRAMCRVGTCWQAGRLAG